MRLTLRWASVGVIHTVHVQCASVAQLCSWWAQIQLLDQPGPRGEQGFEATLRAACYRIAWEKR